MHWRRGLVVSSPPAIVDTGTMGHEIESRKGIHRVVVKQRNSCYNPFETGAYNLMSGWPEINASLYVYMNFIHFYNCDVGYDFSDMICLNFSHSVCTTFDFHELY
jgi:hypothetical protein